jgi:hypothetical protein
MNTLAKRIFEILRDARNDLKPCAQGLFGMLTENDLENAVAAALAADTVKRIADERNRNALASPTRLHNPVLPSPIIVLQPECFWCPRHAATDGKYDGLCVSCSKVLDGRALTKTRASSTTTSKDVQ